MQFYTGDWLKDPCLTICSPATRGVWIDLLSAMHESGRSGQLRGTNDQLARLARCLTSDLVHALTELQTTGAAIITERNKIVTVTNRRMEREHKVRSGNVKRQERFREKRQQRPCNGVDPESDPDPYKVQTNKRGSRPTLQDVLTKCEMSAVPKEEGERFWHHFESSGWIDKNGHPVQKWESKLATWSTSSRSAKGESAHYSGGVSASAMMVRDSKDLERIEKRLANLRAGYADHQTWTPADATERQRLVQRKKELKKALGLMV